MLSVMYITARCDADFITRMSWEGEKRDASGFWTDQGGGKRRSGGTSAQDFRRRSKKLLNRNTPASIPGIQTGRGAIGSGCMSNSAALKANATPSPKQITALINLTVRILAFSNSNGFLGAAESGV